MLSMVTSDNDHSKKRWGQKWIENPEKYVCKK